MRRPVVGIEAPDFNLPAYSKGEFKDIKLSDYRGKWVCLMFYPNDFTFVCPTEMLSYSSAIGQFTELDCQVIGISIDSHHTHKAWVETAKGDGRLGGSLEFPLAADLKKTATEPFGILEEATDVAPRGLFQINPEGMVMHATINYDPVGRSADEALRTLSAFQYVASHDGEVCPAGWTVGALATSMVSAVCQGTLNRLASSMTDEIVSLHARQNSQRSWRMRHCDCGR